MACQTKIYYEFLPVSFVKNKTKLLKGREEKINSVFPIVELIRNYQYNLLFKFTINNFNILVPHLDRQNFTTTGLFG